MKNNPPTAWKIRHALKPGDIGYLIYMHGALYAKEHGFDQTFETYVAHGLLQFAEAFNPYRDRILLADVNGRIAGSCGIVRTSKVEAQLRWYLVHPEYRGQGLGTQLIRDALKFCRERKYTSVFLWTTSDLAAAGHIYTQQGFKRTQVKSHNIWGKFVSEERYELSLA